MRQEPADSTSDVIGIVCLAIGIVWLASVIALLFWFFAVEIYKYQQTPAQCVPLEVKK